MSDTRKIRAALILDGMQISVWQANALSEALPMLDLKLIINCQNTVSPKNIVKNFLYYLVNMASLRNYLSQKTKYVPENERIISFESEYSGKWQKLTPDVLKAIDEEQITVVIKFGMGLLRIDEDSTQYDIVSFHHGNPSKYRGRPAGFYEMLNNETSVGIIVQILGNKLDAGKVLAFGESKVVPYSYKKTALNYYSSSRYLLKKAVVALNENRSLEFDVSGKNYRLPGNIAVVGFVCRVFVSACRKLIYGIVIEKRWKVAISESNIDPEDDNVIEFGAWNEVPISTNYNFYADPFFSSDHKSIRLEALGNKSGLGDIVEVSVSSLTEQKLLLTGQHFSYPFSFLHDGMEYLLPEVASYSAQFYIAMNRDCEEKYALKGLEHKRIVDATLFLRNDSCFLFFGEEVDAQMVLHLWVSNSVDEEFSPHPCSPICLSPSSARMGGRILAMNNKIYRLGQNNERGYGESLTISEVTALTERVYEERQCGTVVLQGAKGPHSLDLDAQNNRILFDFYDESFSVFAGLRRLKARLS